MKGMMNVEGLVSLLVIITAFAVTYPLLDEMVTLLQANAGTTVDLISSAFIPIMAIMIIAAIARANNRPPAGYYSPY